MSENVLKTKVYIATNNMNKLTEIEKILPSGAFEVHPLSDLGKIVSWDETGSTFQENAEIKARALKAFTSDAVLADDSGLVVPALGGSPGVFSARYAGPEATDEMNNQKLIAELKGITNRDAYFQCTLCYISGDDKISFFSGQCNGKILETPKGSNGFGYDPLFYSEELELSFGETPLSLKNSVSHRKKALQAFAESLKYECPSE